MLGSQPEIDFRILPNIRFLTKAARIALHHHESYDGKGYLQDLQGEETELEMRILAVVEAKKAVALGARSRIRAGIVGLLQEIAKMYGMQFDSLLVKEFLKIPVST